MPHIVSTLSADVDYTTYYKKSEPGGVNVVEKKIRVKGGANVANRKLLNISDVLTPKGVVTHVSEEDLGHLEKDEVFQTHKKNGFIQVVKSNSAPNGDKVAKDLEEKDASAPFSPEDYEEGGRAQKMAHPGADDLKAPKATETSGSKKKGGK